MSASIAQRAVHCDLSMALADARGRGTILHFIDTTGPGGAETIFLQIASGMRDRGWSGRSIVVGPGWVLDRLRTLALPCDLVETHGRFDVRYLWQIHALVHRHRVRLIHAHLFSPAVYASLVGALHRIPVVATFHGTSDADPGGMANRWRRRLIGRRASIVCVSEALAAAVHNSMTGVAHEQRVIYNGVDVSQFGSADGHRIRHEHGIPRDVFLIGSLGNMRPAKDYPNLLRAAAQLANARRVAFAIVGDKSQPLYNDLLNLRSELGLERIVSFWGFRQDVPDVLAAFDALAISSSSEGFSLAAVQAMAASKPVVATRCGGPEEIITDGVDGLLVKPSTPGALAEALRSLAHSSALCSELGAAARRTAVARFSIERMLDAYEELYMERISAA